MNSVAPSEGMPLAVWLGHLRQFAYVPRSGTQTAQDKDIEDFVRHLYAFEIYAIPAWLRVRGRAPEFAHAQRMFSGVTQPFDYSYSIVDVRQPHELR